MAASLKRTEYYYDTQNALQNVAVWEFPEDQAAIPAPAGTVKYWLIFVHGGAWRDPRGTFNEAEPTIAALLDDPTSPHYLADASSRIAGFASLNYRLSPHPLFAQDPDNTPFFGTRTAQHPDHLVDTFLGLRFLQRRFGFGNDYVFFGHSAGGFLNYQVLLGDSCLGGYTDAQGKQDKFEDVHLPVAVVGFEGIYDLAGLDDRMKGTYASFIEPAFGPRGGWDAASPATAKGNFKTGWFDKVGKLAVLAQSPDDELVDMAECDVMEKRLRDDGVGRILVFRDLAGGHFEVLRDGSFARVLKATLEELEKL